MMNNSWPNGPEDMQAEATREVMEEEALEDVMETCDDCSERFMPDGESNYFGSPDRGCSPHTRMVAYCGRCYAARGMRP